MPPLKLEIKIRKDKEEDQRKGEEKQLSRFIPSQPIIPLSLLQGFLIKAI